MAKYSAPRRTSSGSSSGTSRGASSSRSGVSQARLSQRSGSSNAFGGFTKVKNTDGSFRMRPTQK